MENGQSMNVSQTQDSLMNTLVRRDLSNDVMARRLKNRERQRRYRARKRLEADIKKSSVHNNLLATPEVDQQLNGSLSNGITRVYCQRNWKKDARRVTKSKYPEDALHGFVKPHAATTMSQTILPSDNKAAAQVPVEWESQSSLSLVNCETIITKLGRRDWKADARKKKS